MTALIAPIGTFLSQFDTAIDTAQTAAVTGVVAAMKAPIAAMGVIYFAFMGWRIAAGDHERINSFTFAMAKIGAIFFLAANLAPFNTWVVGVFEHGFVTSISNAAVGTSTSAASTDTGVGTAIDAIWNNMWVRAAQVWQQSGLTDFSSPIIAAITVLMCGIGLVLIAGVYLIARFLFAIVVVLGPVAIACAMFPSTRAIFERWIGKGVALIVLQVAAVVTLQIIFQGAQTFITPATASASLPMQLQNMVAMTIWVAMSAFAVYSLPALAYSLGTGVAVSLTPIVSAAIGAAALASRIGSGSRGGSGQIPSPPSGGTAPDINLSAHRAELASPAVAGGTAPAHPAPHLLLPAPTPLLTFEG